MIVKNESSVIERNLRSVYDHIDYWVIVDTGSEDDTIEIIKNYLKDIPGQLIESPWVNFSYNRNEALAYAKGKADYLLIIDADEELQFDDDFEWPTLGADSYSIESIYGNLAYHRTQLLANNLDWKWHGVVHEYVACVDADTNGVLQNVRNIPRTDGARSNDGDKFLKDAQLLETALKNEPDDLRNLFYLAQSYRDAGLPEKSLCWYQERVKRGGWEQEVWYSLYQVAVLQQRLEQDWGVVLQSYLKAYQYRPERSEPLFKIARYYREREEYNNAYLFSKMAMEIPYPSDSLFVEKTLYDYYLPMEYAICCYWLGKHHEAIRVNNIILERTDLPKNVHQQAVKNRKYSLDLIYSTEN